MSIVAEEIVSGDRPSSPSILTCSICLGHIIHSLSHPSGCKHWFCYECLFKWSEIKYECPLCKIPFSSIMTMTGEELKEIKLPQGPLPEPGPRSFQITAHSTVVIFQGSYINFRRFIYEKGYRANLRANPIYNPDIFTMQPLQLDRLRPWLERELSVLLPLSWKSIVPEFIRVLSSYSLEDPYLFATIHEKLREATYHFRHELRLFSSSYFDMSAWDRNAFYYVDSLPVHPNNRRQDDDVEIVDIRPPMRPVTIDVEIITVPDNEIELIELDQSDDEIIAIPGPSRVINLTAETSIPLSTSPQIVPEESTSTRRSQRLICSETHDRPNSRMDSDGTNSDRSSSSSPPPSRSRRRKSHSKREKKKKSKKSRRRYSPVTSSVSSDSGHEDFFEDPLRRRFPSMRSVVVVPQKN